jgi:hypothetical protein
VLCPLLMAGAAVCCVLCGCVAAAVCVALPTTWLVVGVVEAEKRSKSHRKLRHTRRHLNHSGRKLFGAGSALQLLPLPGLISCCCPTTNPSCCLWKAAALATVGIRLGRALLQAGARRRGGAQSGTSTSTITSSCGLETVQEGRQQLLELPRAGRHKVGACARGAVMRALHWQMTRARRLRNHCQPPGLSPGCSSVSTAAG